MKNILNLIDSGTKKDLSSANNMQATEAFLRSFFFRPNCVVFFSKANFEMIFLANKKEKKKLKLKLVPGIKPNKNNKEIFIKDGSYR